MTEGGVSKLSGLHILVVEDDYMIATDLALSLQSLGVLVIGPAGSVEDALALAGSEPAPDAAVLDINLGAEKVFPVADALRAQGVPFVFTTGYDEWLIPEVYKGTPRFEKPVDAHALAVFFPVET
jgi:CheY-like chemotaxis protein